MALPTLAVIDGNEDPQTISTLNSGRQAADDSSAVALSSEDKTALDNAVTSLQLIDDAVIADDAAFTPASTKVVMAGATFDDAAPDSVNEGDAGALRMSANRNLYVNIRDNAGAERGLNIDGNGRLSVSDISTSIVPGTNATHLGKAEDALHASGDTGVMALAVRADTAAPTGGNGDYVPLLTDDEGKLWVSDTAATTAIDALADLVAEVPHGDADAGSPSKIGGKAVAGVSGQTPVSAADRTDALFGTDGVQIVRHTCGLEDLVDGVNSNTDGSSTQVIAAAGVGVKQYLTWARIVNMHASATVYVEIKSGTTVKDRLPVPPGGCVVTYPTPLRPNADNEAWNFDASAATTTLYYSAGGFKSKV
jgi:hypothetical protein